MTKQPAWTPFQRGYLPEATEEQVQGMAASLGRPVEEVRAAMAADRVSDVWLNSRYQVNVYRDRVPQSPDWPAFIWLSIKRLDKQPIHDWRDLQRIKSEIIGPEHEAIEIYPAESRVVDTANQYHLWVLADPTISIPVGFSEGLKVDRPDIFSTVEQRRFDPVLAKSYDRLALERAWAVIERILPQIGGIALDGEHYATINEVGHYMATGFYADNS